MLNKPIAVLEAVDMPTSAAGGYALGGGLEIAFSYDFRHHSADSEATHHTTNSARQDEDVPLRVYSGHHPWQRWYVLNVHRMHAKKLLIITERTVNATREAKEVGILILAIVLLSWLTHFHRFSRLRCQRGTDCVRMRTS